MFEIAAQHSITDPLQCTIQRIPISPQQEISRRPTLFLPRRAKGFQWILKQAQTGLVAKLKKVRTAVVSQIKGPWSSAPCFSQWLRRCLGKSVETGWVVPDTFPAHTLPQFSCCIWGCDLAFWYLSFSIVW